MFIGITRPFHLNCFGFFPFQFGQDDLSLLRAEQMPELDAWVRFLGPWEGDGDLTFHPKMEAPTARLEKSRNFCMENIRCWGCPGGSPIPGGIPNPADVAPTGGRSLSLPHRGFGMNSKFGDVRTPTTAKKLSGTLSLKGFVPSDGFQHRFQFHSF